MKKVIKREETDNIYIDELENGNIHVCLFRDNKYILCFCEGGINYRWARLTGIPMSLYKTFVNKSLAIDYMLDIEASVYEAEDLNEALKFFSS